MLEFEPLPGPFGRQVREIDVADLADDDLAALLHELYRHRILVLRTGGLSADDYIDFAYRVGDPLKRPGVEAHAEIIPITNVGVDTSAEKRGAAHWHTDQSFTEPVASVTMLYSVKAPTAGGETRFCDMAAAYAALDEETRDAIEDLMVLHRHGVSIVAQPDDHVPIPPRGWDPDKTVKHPLVRRHPITGEKTLYAITGTSQGIEGLSRAEAKALLVRFCRHAFAEPFLNSHQHAVGDILMWDNPTTMHSASPIEAATDATNTREIRRISLRGTPSVFAD